MYYLNTYVLSPVATVLLLSALLLFAAACDTVEENGHEEHPELAMLEIIDRGDAQQPVIATWTEDDGWDVDELEFSTPLREGGDRVEIGFQAYGHELEPLSLEEDGEFFLTYDLAQDAAEDVIDTSLNDDDLFHGDHAYIYPLSEGETAIEFVLWHVEHPEDGTSPITVRVLAPEAG